MNPDTSKFNLKWFIGKSGQYPYQIITSLSLRPEEVDKTIPVAYNFIRVPFDGRAFWGFDSEISLQWFKKNYSGHLLTPQQG